ncbi:MAG: 4-(cytidine 5'-diphospho)-2-C-methyl-D-erythritol kinase [Alistipes sp.]|nr:4-(cytidine 5'-diphospho)-2-C-methyl-D-erythritol kinase [Alistipes sp.]
MELRAHCKINLGLRVMRRRGDGFHDIETVMMAVGGLADTVAVTALPSEATFAPLTPPPYPAPAPVFPLHSVLEVSGLEVDCAPEENICMRALRLMQSEFGIGEAVVRLHKVVPAGAGLGGGSADAAAVLRAVNEEFVLELTESELEGLAGRLGSDVPFFVRENGNARGGKKRRGGVQFCTGRGEVMTPVEVDLAGLWLVVARPDVAVSTAEAYSGITPREGGDSGRLGGSARWSDEGFSLPDIVGRPVAEWRELLRNDFEESVFARHPEIGAVKRALYDMGAAYASMSGSGSAVFGIFERRPEGLAQALGSIFRHVEQL